jgi:hypothetical protein
MNGKAGKVDSLASISGKKITIQDQSIVLAGDSLHLQRKQMGK